jgi:hypothetical protein
MNDRIPAPSDRLSSTATAGMIIAVTADDDRYEFCRAVAMDLAVRESARLLLYDWDAATVIGDPLPSNWSADGNKEQVPLDLDSAALSAAGRGPIGRQVEEAVARGIHAVAWLPSKTGFEGLAEYARYRRASTIVVPESLQSDGHLERLAEGDADPIRAMDRLPPIRVIVASP